MRHRMGFKKLNRTSSHKKAMLANMAVSLVMHERIKTTLVKAKVLRPYVERLITKARKGTLVMRRYLVSKIKSKEAVEKLISVIGIRERKGGYTRILKGGNRYGDMASIAYIELVDGAVIKEVASTTQDQGASCKQITVKKGLKEDSKDLSKNDSSNTHG